MKQVRKVPALARRVRTTHKGDCGRVLVLAGSEGMLGAAILCAQGALRGGAGLVKAMLPKAQMAPFTIAVPSAVTVPRTWSVARAVADSDAVVVGPGLGTGQAAKKFVLDVVRASRAPVVLDADALTVLAPLRSPPRSKAPLVLTPHPGEAGRLLGSTAQRVQDDRPAALAELCEKSGAVVVLKGAGTLVGDGERWFRNTTGNPGMATGGSGDVLSGLIGALLGQGMDPFAAACLGAHVHGKAGDLVSRRLSERGLAASDLPLAIAEVMP